MNCNEFDRRLQQQLDERLLPEGDPDLSRHLAACETCRGKLAAWRQIAFVMPAEGTVSLGAATESGATRSGQRLRRGWMPVAATLAAAAVWAFFIPRQEVGSGVDIQVDGGAAETVVAQASSGVDPSLWWNSVQDRDWVGQTMPAVRSVRDGVAPLGRSLLQAVTILTSGGGESLADIREERPS